MVKIATIKNGIVEIIILSLKEKIPIKNKNKKIKHKQNIPIYINALLGLLWNKVTSKMNCPINGISING
ncbi:MAG: hypothetical protein JSS78_08025 [Bacteroidetes bacterium]|nr:hypothetical protein [Bacteroidota bacterium]